MVGRACSAGVAVLAALAPTLAVLACTPFDASSSPAPTPAPAPTTTPGDDAAVAQTPPSPDAQAPRFCSAAHALCDDFDVGEIGGLDRWTSATNVPAFALSADKPVSAPNALRVTADPGVEPAALVKLLDRNATSVRCDLDLELAAALPMGGRTDLLHIRMATGGSPADSVTAILFVSDQGLGMTGRLELKAVATPLDEYYFGSVPQPARWLHVRATLTPGSSQMSIEIPTLGSHVQPWSGVTGASASVEISVGLLVGHGGPFNASFDNVVCDTTP